MSRKKPSKADYAALQRGRPVVSYPPGSNRVEIRLEGNPSRARAYTRVRKVGASAAHLAAIA